jgi:RNA polymerase sigma factor FliA
MKVQSREISKLMLSSKAYQSQITRKEKLIQDNLKIVYQVVNKLSFLKPAGLDEEDLISCGIIGLIEAANKYEESKKNSFASFAYLRVKGSIVDQLRLTDILSRSARKRVKILTTCISELEQELGQMPTDEEIANKLEISLVTLHSIQKEASLSTLSLDLITNEESETTLLEQLSDQKSGPEENCENKMFQEALASAIDQLPAREKLIIGLYHYRHLPMRKIAEILKVSESRACQLHNRGITLLKVKLDKFLS